MFLECGPLLLWGEDMNVTLKGNYHPYRDIPPVANCKIFIDEIFVVFYVLLYLIYLFLNQF